MIQESPLALSAGDAYLDIGPRLAAGFGQQLSSQVQGPLGRAGEEASRHFGRRFAHGIGTVIKGIGIGIAAGLGLALAAVIRLTPVLRQSVAGYRDHLKVVAQTTAAIKSTGGAAGVSVKQVGQLADALERKTTVDGDVIQSGQNMLLTFKNVRNEVGKGNDIFNQASATVLDMAAAFGHGQVSSAGMQQASIQLGKALGDPIAGIGALSRVGVTFTKQQKDQIKTLVESGNRLAAQKIILKELNSEFGGSAAAQATAAGRMQVAWHQLQDTIGSILLPVVDRFENTLGRRLIPDLNVLATRYGPAITAFLTRWVEGFSDALPSTRQLGFGLTALGAAFSGEGITSSADSFVGRMERLGVTGRRVVDWARGLRPMLDRIGQSFAKLFSSSSQVGPALQQAGGGGHVFANSLIIIGPVLDAVARNLHNILPWLPAILAGFLGFRALRSVTQPLVQLGELIGNITAPFRIAALFAQNRALRAHTVALVENSAAMGGNTVATELATGAANVGVIATLRQRAAAIASAVAQRAVAVATRAWAVAQRLLNLAMATNPIGLVILAVAGLAAGLIFAWRHSETFRRIVTGAFNAVKGAALAVWNWIRGNWPLLLAVLTGPIGLAVLAIVRNWDRIKSGAVSAFNAVVSFVRGIPGRIRSAVGDLGGVLLDAGRAVIRGLINGILGQLGPLGDALRRVGQFIAAHKGPRAADLVLLRPAGQAIMEGLIAGIAGETPTLQAQLAGISGMIGGQPLSLRPGTGGAAVPLAAAATPGHPNIVINAHTNASAADIAREFAWQQKTSGR